MVVICLLHQLVTLLIIWLASLLTNISSTLHLHLHMFITIITITILIFITIQSIKQLDMQQRCAVLSCCSEIVYDGSKNVYNLRVGNLTFSPGSEVWLAQWLLAIRDRNIWFIGWIYSLVGSDDLHVYIAIRRSVIKN